MTGWHWLDLRLRTDPRDAGCDETTEALPEYAELLASGGGADAAGRHPGVATHLEGCESCAANLLGLLDALRAEHGRTQKH